MSNILWIDDKAGSGTKARYGFDALIYFIEQNGHNVEITPTGESIGKAIRSNEVYDLIILDIIMDSLSETSSSKHQYGGFDALELLMEIRPQTPIILLSVMSREMITDEAARREIDLAESEVKEILRKGEILPENLGALVEKILLETKKSKQGDDNESTGVK